VSSADEQTQRVGQLIERLLVDAPFRAEFRKGPADACRALGLSELAEEIGAGGRSMHTLELRESKSSLAGVVMAVAAEGIGVVELHGLVEHGLLKGELRAAGEQALRGVNPMHPASSLHSELRGENPLRGAAHNPLGAAERSSQLARQAEQSGAGGQSASSSSAAAGTAPGAATGGAAGTSAPGGAAGAAAPGGAATNAAAPGGSAASASTPGGSGAAAGTTSAAGAPSASGQPGSAAPFPTTQPVAPSAPPTPGAGSAAVQSGTPTPSAGGVVQSGTPTPSAGGVVQSGTSTPSAGGVVQSGTSTPSAGGVVQSGAPSTGGAVQAGTATPSAGGAAQAGTSAPSAGGAVPAGARPPGEGGAAAQAGTLTPSEPEAEPVAGGGAQTPAPAPTPPVPGAQPAAGGAVPVWPEPSQAPAGSDAVVGSGAPLVDLSAQGVTAGGSSAGLAELLDSPHLALPPDVRAVFTQGHVDPRIVSVLDNAVAHHNIVLGDIETSTEPVHAQAIDIISVDGQAVGPGNVAARDLITEIAAMEPGTRPNEIGTPWPIQSQGFFTDLQHQNRLHLAFTSTGEYDPQAPGGSAYPAGPAGSYPAVTAGTGAGAPAAAAGTGAAVGSAEVAGAPGTSGGVAEQSAAGTSPAASPGSAVASAPVSSSGSTAGSAQDAMGGGGAAGHAGEAAAALSDPNWASVKAHAAYEVAKSELGVPYLWGGTSPKTGFDCSGLMQYAYGRVGIHIPRVAAEQFQVGTPVGLHQLREGDLVFFKESDGYIHHVGMYVGDGRFIQAPQTGENVDYGNLRDPYFAQQFAGGRRITPLTASPTASAAASGSATGQVGPAATSGSSAASAAGGGATVPAGSAPSATAGAVPAAGSGAATAAAPAGAPTGAPAIQVAAGPLPPEAPPQPGTAVFKALQAQEASYLRHTVKFLQAVPPPGAGAPAGQAAGAAAQTPGAPAAAAAQAAGQSPTAGTGAAPGEAAAATTPDVAGQAPSGASDQIIGGESAHAGGAEAAAGAIDATSGTIPYPGDNAPKAEIAQWMGDIAQKHGLPRQLPVMAALVESSLHNDPGGDRDSVGYFQMRTGIWDNGPYAGYPNNPALQLKWFIDQAVAVKERMQSSDPSFGTEPSHYGDWIAEVEQPAYEYRGRYQLQLDAARELLGDG
jgi:cell wall-associated NlpC family hydrolase